MSDFTAVFDKHDLSTLFVIEPVSRQLTTWEPALAENVIGSIATGTKAQPLEVTLDLTTFAATPQARMEALRTLSSWLAVDEPKSLVLTDEVINKVWSGGQWVDTYALRDALPSGTPTITRALNADTARVKFVCPDPRAYETMVNFLPTPPSTGISDTKNNAGSVWDSESDIRPVTIRGTAQTKPKFYFNGLCGNDSDSVTIRLRHMDGAHQKTQSIVLDIAHDASLNVEIDFEKRLIRSYSSPTWTPMYSLDVDWFDLVPGAEYTIDFPYGGSWTRMGFSYYPRWW